MSNPNSAGEAQGVAPGDTGYAGDWPGPDDSPQSQAGPFVFAACKCEWPHCENVATGYCKMHRIFLEAFE